MQINWFIIIPRRYYILAHFNDTDTNTILHDKVRIPGRKLSWKRK